MACFPNNDKESSHILRTDVSLSSVQQFLSTHIGTSHAVYVHGDSACGKTSFVRLLMHDDNLQCCYRTRKYWVTVGKVETLKELLVIFDFVGQQIISDHSSSRDCIYRPGNIEDWILYIKDCIGKGSTIIVLDDVRDQFVVDTFLALGVALVVSSTLLDLKFIDTHVHSISLGDLCQEDVLSLTQNVIGPSLPLEASPHKLLTDISRSPLEVLMLCTMIARSVDRSQSYMESLVARRAGLASGMMDAMDQEKGISTHTSPLTANALPHPRSPATSSGRCSGRSGDTHIVTWDESRMRRVSIYITMQMVLSTLPEHLQAKYVLLAVLPRGSPVSIPFLCALWNVNESTAVSVVSDLHAAHLLEWEFILHNSQCPLRDTRLVTLHDIQHDYIATLLSQSIWASRASIAASRAAEYLSSSDAHCADDPLFPHSLATPCRLVRLGVYWRQILDFQQRGLVSNDYSPLALFDKHIQEMHHLSDVSAAVSYIKHACIVVEEICMEEVVTLIEWYRLLLRLMEEDPLSSHTDIALCMDSYALLLLHSGDEAGAEAAFLQSYRINSSVHGREHCSVSSAASRLAILMQRQGRLAEATDYMRDSVEIKSKLHGTRHLRVGRELNNLAMLHSSQGMYSEATLCHMGAIYAFQSSLGEEHVETINARGNMGITLLLQGNQAGLGVLQDVICLLMQSGIPTTHPWMKKFVAHARAPQRGNEEGNLVDDLDILPQLETLRPPRPSSKLENSEKGSGSSSSSSSSSSSGCRHGRLGVLSKTSMRDSYHLHPLSHAGSDVGSFNKFVEAYSVRMTDSPSHLEMLSSSLHHPENEMSPVCRISQVPAEKCARGDVDDSDRLPYAALVLTE